MNRPDDWNVRYLLGLIHLERLDAEGAQAALSTAAKLHRLSEIQQALAEARSMEPRALTRLRIFEGCTDAEAVALSGDGCLALSGGYEHVLRLWDVSSGKCIRKFDGHSSKVTSVALSASHALALSGSWDDTVRLWDVSSGECLRIFAGHAKDVTSVALSADGRLALSASEDHTVRLWQADTGKCLRTDTHADYATSLALSTDGRWAVSGSSGLRFSLWDVNSGKCLRTFEGHKGYAGCAVLSADSRWALSGSDDHTVRLWNVSSGKCLQIFDGHTGNVDSVALTADGRWALSGSHDHTLRLWEVSSGRCLRTWKYKNTVRAVALSADGRLGIATTGDKSLPLSVCDLRGLYDKQQTGTAPFAVCRVAGAAETLSVQKTFHGLLDLAVKHYAQGEFGSAFSVAIEARTLPGHQFAPEALGLTHRAGLRGKRTGLRGGWRLRTFEGHKHPVLSVVRKPGWAMGFVRRRMVDFRRRRRTASLVGVEQRKVLQEV